MKIARVLLLTCLLALGAVEMTVASGTAVAGGTGGGGDGVGGTGGAGGDGGGEQRGVDVGGSDVEEDGSEEEGETLGRKRRVNVNPPDVCRPFAKSRRSLQTEANAFMKTFGDRLYTESGSMHRSILRGLSVSDSSFLPFFEQHAAELEIGNRERAARRSQKYTLEEKKTRWVTQQVENWGMDEDEAKEVWDQKLAAKIHAELKEELEIDMDKLRTDMEERYGCGKRMDEYSRSFSGDGSGGGGGLGGGAGGIAT